LFEVSGRNQDDDWANVKILCKSMEEVTTLIQEASESQRS